MSAFLSLSSAKLFEKVGMCRIFLGMHPAWDKSLVLANNTHELHVQQSIADKEGYYFAAILSPKNEQRLVVWSTILT
jgi:hypothetical protein